MSVNTVPETQMELKRAALINIGCTCLGKSWQTAMAERLGVSQRTLRYWVSGEYEVPDKFLYKAFEVGKQRISEIETCLSQQQELIDNMVLDSFQTIYGVLNEDGNVELFYKTDGERVTVIPNAANLYPVRSKLSAEYQHDRGIVITRSDAKKYNIEIE